MEVQQLYIDLVVQANDAGVHYPLWATCLGFEALSIAISKDFNLLSSFDAWDLSLPLEFTPNFKNSTLFGANTPIDVVNILGTQAVTLNNHHYGGTL